jgi:hypothetical protein
MHSDIRMFGSAVKLLDHFGPDMLNYALCLIVVALHLVLARFTDFQIAPPISWLEELGGPDSDAFPLVVQGATSANESTAPENCLHEEGGKFAVYDQCDKACLQKIGDLYIGPSYRVISCRYFSNY